MKVYSKPLYYDIAFDFVNIKKQIRLFESFIKKYSHISVRRLLDVGCGPSSQLLEFAEQGYQSVGLDASAEMIKYLKDKAINKGVNLETVKANFIDFKLPRKVDFAFMLMGTISYVDSNSSFNKHLDSIASSLNKGGLYLIENMIINWVNPNFYQSQAWTMKKNGIVVKTSFKTTVKDTLNQLLNVELNLEVNDNGRKIQLPSKYTSKLIFPQELRELVANNDKFEFIGWFERFSTKPLRKTLSDNVLILRKK